MSAKRSYYALGVIALFAVLTLAARAAFGAVEAQQNSQIDSATRSYMAWAHYIEEQQSSTSDDRAEAIRLVQARMAWAKAFEEQQSSAFDDRAEAIRLVQARMAWAKAFEEQRLVVQPTVVP